MHVSKTDSTGTLGFNHSLPRHPVHLSVALLVTPPKVPNQSLVFLTKSFREQEHTHDESGEGLDDRLYMASFAA